MKNNHSGNSVSQNKIKSTKNRIIGKNNIYEIDTTSISSIIKSICHKILEKHFNAIIEENDIIALSSGLIKLSITTFSISLLCEDIEKVREYIYYINSKPTDEELVKYLEELEPYLDKDKYILNTTKLLYDMLNDSFSLDFSELDLEKIDQELLKRINSSSIITDRTDENLTMHELLNYYRSINPHKDMIIPDYELFFEYTKLGFSDSREVFDNVKLKKDKNYEMFDKIEEILKSVDELDGLNSLVKDIESTEIIKLFNNEEVGKHIIRCVTFLENYYNNIEKINIEDRKLYMKDLIAFLDIPEILSNEEINPVIIEAIRNYSYYMDMDKLINLVFKVLEKKLEADKLNPKDGKNVLEKILKLKKKNSIQTNCSSIISRFVDNDFLPQQELNNVKEKLLNGEINVDSIDKKIFDLLKLNKQEIELIMDYNINNYIWGIKILGYNNKQAIKRYNSKCKFTINELIIELYRLKKLSEEDLIELYVTKTIDISFFCNYYNEISFTKNLNTTNIFNEYKNYKNSFKQLDNDKIKIEIMSEVHRVNNIKDVKSLNMSSKEFVDNCMEDIDSNEDIVYFYLKGVISLEIVAEWCGEAIVKKLFNDKKIDLESIEKLYRSKKVSKSLVEQVVLSTNPSDDDLLDYMFKNYITEETIIKIFLTRNIYSKEALKLKELNIISKMTYIVIKNRDIKEMEARIGRNLEGMKEIEDIEMPKIKGNTIALPKVENKADLKQTKEEDKYNCASSKSQKTLINPFIRIEYLKLLKCKSPEYINYDDEKNPFYHYNFYVIQDDYLGDDITNDAIIIAERIYKNRDNPKEFATDNATYVMKYEDYLTLQGKQKELQLKNKKGVLKEVPGAIYQVNHRSRSWAMNLLKAIAMSKAGSSMEKLTANNKRCEILNWLSTIYTEDDLAEIFELIEEIDDYELHTYRPDRFGIFRSIREEDLKVYTKINKEVTY